MVGAVQALAPHPTDPDILYIGAVNGGIWRTGNATATDPDWTPLTDAQPSLSIGAIAYDPTDSANNTVVAGIGRFSSISAGGSGGGILRTADDGVSWTLLGNVALAGANIAGVAPRGATIVVADNNSGIWRSTDTGANWTLISGAAGTGLNVGGARALAGVVGDPTRLFTTNGSRIFMSTDTGATWTSVSNAAMNNVGPYSNVRIATGAGAVDVALASGGTLGAVFQSTDNGTTWSNLGVPTTVEAGVTTGIHPGGQAGTHLSLAADPVNANLLYIGGDRQPAASSTTNFPNSIGARNFSGRLFRGNVAAASGPIFVHLTHSNSLGAAGGGTADGSAPHADSRNMAFDAAGTLLEVDDGGIYRRTSAQDNTGVWQSMIGNLRTTEFHSARWDAVTRRIIGGAQDTGVPEQDETEAERWPELNQADGGVVAIDDISTPGRSTRFYSSQNLGSAVAPQLTTKTYDSSNAVVATGTAPMTVLSGGAAINPQFYSPVAVNAADGTRLLIGAANGVYESLDSGQTVTSIGTMQVNGGLGQALAYGAADNAEMIYLGAGSQIFTRSIASPGAPSVAASYPGTNAVVGVAMDPANSQTAYAVDAGQVFQTLDGGANWTDVTGDLATLSPGQIRSVAVVSLAEVHAVAVGTDRGVFWAANLPATQWTSPCSGLPNAPVAELSFAGRDGLLLAGTLGRGAWTCAPGVARPSHQEVKFVCGRGDGKVLDPGTYRTAINIASRAPDGSPAVRYRRSFTVALPGEVAGNSTVSAPGASLAPGEAAEIDCDDILAETRAFCLSGLCKGFVAIDSPVPLDIVAVYSSANPATGAVTDLTTERQGVVGGTCPDTTLQVPEQTLLFVPPHTGGGDRDFDGNGPCVNFDTDLRLDDDGTLLVADYHMQAFECSGGAAQVGLHRRRGERPDPARLVGSGRPDPRLFHRQRAEPKLHRHQPRRRPLCLRRQRTGQRLALRRRHRRRRGRRPDRRLHHLPRDAGPDADLCGPDQRRLTRPTSPNWSRPCDSCPNVSPRC